MPDEVAPTPPSVPPPRPGARPLSELSHEAVTYAGLVIGLSGVITIVLFLYGTIGVQLGNRLDVHDQAVKDRFAALDHRFEGIDKRIDGLEARLVRVEARLDRVVEDVAALRTEVRVLASEQKANREAMDRGFAELRDLLKARSAK